MGKGQQSKLQLGGKVDDHIILKSILYLNDAYLIGFRLLDSQINYFLLKS